MTYQPNDQIRLVSGFEATVIADYGDEVEVRVEIGGWCPMLMKVRRDEIVTDCAECGSVIGDRFELRDDGCAICPDCYADLYGQRDAEDARWRAADYYRDKVRDA